jgi:putative transposase
VCPSFHKPGLAAAAADWPWSSTAAHLAGSGAPYVDVEPALARIDDFAAFFTEKPDDAARWSTLLKAEQVGRPVGAKAWIADLEKQHGRALSPAKRGPKPRLAPSPEDNGDLFGN